MEKIMDKSNQSVIKEILEPLILRKCKHSVRKFDELFAELTIALPPYGVTDLKMFNLIYFNRLGNYPASIVIEVMDNWIINNDRFPTIHQLCEEIDENLPIDTSKMTREERTSYFLRRAGIEPLISPKVDYPFVPKAKPQAMTEIQKFKLERQAAHDTNR
jgi:hypothetical protein